MQYLTRAVVVGLFVTLISCTTMTDWALSALSPAKGGISTEIVVGDKEQVLGTNQDIKATSIGKVVGQNDSSTAIQSAKEVTVNNTTYPGWLIIMLLLGNVVFLCLPTPTQTFKFLWSKRK